MITKAIVVNKPGPPDVLSYEDIEVQPPGEGEVMIQHHAIGVNFVDTYFRSGLYPWKGDPPMIIGAEGSGEIIELGPSVSEFDVGDRVAYTVSNGAYCAHRVIAADRVVKLPDEIDYKIAAAAMLKGLTVHYLFFRTFKVQPGHKILFHAAAGGVGLLAGQWASKMGAEVIGTVSTKEKLDLALSNGYHHIINYKEENFVDRVMEITKGEGVDVVYDSVGKDTYPQSLNCLKRLGHWVSFGQSSGMIQSIGIGDLAGCGGGSLTASRPRLFDYIVTREELQTSASQLFNVLKSGELKVSIKQKFLLEDARKAHIMLESRKTEGSTILIPN